MLSFARWISSTLLRAFDNGTDAPENARRENLQRQESARAVLRARVQIPSCCRDGGMAEGCLNEVDRRAAVECVGRMRVAEPVRRHG